MIAALACRGMGWRAIVVNGWVGILSPAKVVWGGMTTYTREDRGGGLVCRLAFPSPTLVMVPLVRPTPGYNVVRRGERCSTRLVAYHQSARTIGNGGNKGNAG